MVIAIYSWFSYILRSAKNGDCPSLSSFSKGYLKVSWNRGAPKSSILIGFSLVSHPFPIYGNPHLFGTTPSVPCLHLSQPGAFGRFLAWREGSSPVWSSKHQKQWFVTVTIVGISWETTPGQVNVSKLHGDWAVIFALNYLRAGKSTNILILWFVKDSNPKIPSPDHIPSITDPEMERMMIRVKKSLK